MNQCSIDQIISDCEEIKKLAKGTLFEKDIIDHCENIRQELAYSVNPNQEV